MVELNIWIVSGIMIEFVPSYIGGSGYMFLPTACKNDIVPPTKTFVMVVAGLCKLYSHIHIG